MAQTAAVWGMRWVMAQTAAVWGMRWSMAQTAAVRGMCGVMAQTAAVRGMCWVMAQTAAVRGMRWIMAQTAAVRGMRWIMAQTAAVWGMRWIMAQTAEKHYKGGSPQRFSVIFRNFSVIHVSEATKSGKMQGITKRKYIELKSLILREKKGKKMVGVAGIEPATFCSQSNNI